MSIGTAYTDEERARKREDVLILEEVAEKIRQVGYFTKQELMDRGYSAQNGSYMIATDGQKPERFVLSGVCFEDNVLRFRALGVQHK